MSPPVITVFCAFTREWAIDQWIKDFKRQNYPKDLINLAFIIDMDSESIRLKLKRLIDKGGYRKWGILENIDWSPTETNISVRRRRIVEIKEQSKRIIKLLDGNVVVGFEDDTIFPDEDTLMKLAMPMHNPDVGFYEGVQVGRWGARMVGVWSADDFEFPQIVRTLPLGEGEQLIDAGGFYGYSTRKDLYLDHHYKWDDTQPWGPDVNYGLWVRNKGLHCLVNWELPFGHDDHGTTAFPSTFPITEIVYNRDAQTGHWDRTDTEPGRYQ